MKRSMLSLRESIRSMSAELRAAYRRDAAAGAPTPRLPEPLQAPASPAGEAARQRAASASGVALLIAGLLWDSRGTTALGGIALVWALDHNARMGARAAAWLEQLTQRVRSLEGLARSARLAPGGDPRGTHEELRELQTLVRAMFRVLGPRNEPAPGGSQENP